MKTLVIVPAHNEGATIKDLVTRIKKHNLPVLVVDDGSTDNTSQEIKDLQITVITNQRNSGKGSTLIKGFTYAIENGFDAVITMDGDGQHLPEDIPVFLAAAQKSSHGIIIGNRMTDTAAMPTVRLMTNVFMSWTISKLAGQRIQDTQCGFRLIRREVLQQIPLSMRKFELESEMLLEAGRAGISIKSVTIKTIYASDKSHIRPIRDTFRFFKFIARHIAANKNNHKKFQR